MTFIFPRGWIAGLTLNAVGGTNTFTVTAGQASDSTNAMISNFAPVGTFTKSTASWAVGNGAGALDTGSITATTWYHVHIIDNPTTPGPDILISLSVSAPTLPAGFTTFRRIGSIATDASSHFSAFIQFGDNFIYGNVTQYNLTGSNFGPALFTFGSIPTGFCLRVICYLLSEANASACGTFWCSGLNYIPGLVNYACYSSVTNSISAVYTLSPLTNTSGQIGLQVLGAGAVQTSLQTQGYVDTRGRDL